MDLRPYRGADEGAVLALWNATLTHDAITPATFRTKVLLDPNFSSDGLLVADDGGSLVGFVLSLARLVPLFGQGLEPELGWITAFGFATHDIVRDAVFYAALPAIQRGQPAHRVRDLYFPENWEDMDGWRADLYIDVGNVWDAYLEVLRSHELMRGGVSSFRYLEYYDALGTVRGCLGGFRKAVAVMAPTGSWVQRLDYLPGFAPDTGGC